jgi:hypothetical protein
MKSKRKPTGLQLVAGAIGLKANTLRARLAYHKISTKGMKPTAVAAAMQTKLGHKFTPAQLRKIGGAAVAPPVVANPTAGKGAGVDVRAKNLKVAILALADVEQMILPLTPGRYGLRELRELEALEVLRRLDKP